jgi:hypothetical protein
VKKRTGVAPTPVADRIRGSVVIDEAGCWVWQKFTHYGYGKIYVGSHTAGDRRSASAHRVSYETFVGPIPDGFQIDHLCRNTACVNPEHLQAVSPQLNAIRRAAHNQGYEVCPRGHRLTARTKYLRRGHPSCRLCDGTLVL